MRTPIMTVDLKTRNSKGHFEIKNKKDFDFVIGILHIYRDEIKPEFINPPPWPCSTTAREVKQ